MGRGLGRFYSILTATALGFTSACGAHTSLQTAQRIAAEHESKIRKLTDDEQDLLHELKGDPREIQGWINRNVTYTRDQDQFLGYSDCPDKYQSEKHKGCDVWASAAHVVRTQREDCDGVLALSHYLLDKTGFGLFLDDDDTTDNSAHAVYVFQKNGKYGAISINRAEFRSPVYSSLTDLAASIGGDYTYYKKIELPHDDVTLIYAPNLKDLSDYGDRVNLSKKK